MPRLLDVLHLSSQKPVFARSRFLLRYMMKRFESLRFDGPASAEIAGDILEAVGGVMHPWRTSAQVVLKVLMESCGISRDEVCEVRAAMGVLAFHCERLVAHVWRRGLDTPTTLDACIELIKTACCGAARPERAGKLCYVCSSRRALDAAEERGEGERTDGPGRQASDGHRPLEAAEEEVSDHRPREDAPERQERDVQPHEAAEEEVSSHRHWEDALGRQGWTCLS